MIKIKSILFITIFGLLIFAGALGLQSARATHDFEFTLCHHTPGNEVTLNFNNLQSYQNHTGEPHSGSTYDTEGACASPSPSITPSPSINPCDEWEKEDCQESSPTPSPSVSPSPTATPSATPTEKPKENGSVGTGGGGDGLGCAVFDCSVHQSSNIPKGAPSSGRG